jgi:hypothetical protein
MSADALLAGDARGGSLANLALGIMALILLAAVVRSTREGELKFEFAVIAAWLLVPLIGAYILERIIPAYETRYLLMVVPAFSLLLGFGFEQLLRFRRLLAVAAVVVSGSYLLVFWVLKNREMYANPLYAHGYREAASYFLQNRQDSGIILGLRGDYERNAYDYYLRETGHYLYTSPSAVADQLTALRTGDYNGVWYTSYAVAGPPGAIEGSLETVARPTNLIIEYHTVRLQYFSFGPMRDAQATAEITNTPSGH